MPEHLTDKDRTELLTVLNVALTKARLEDTSGWPQEHINAGRAYQDTIRKWIRRLSQTNQGESAGAE